MTKLFAGIEGGGTKFVVAVGRPDGKILAETRIPTTTPEETLSRCVDFLQAQADALGSLAAIGVACFGPLDLQPASVNYGHILSTPKNGWSNADILGSLRKAFDVPISIDTDVNGAALGEWRWGAAQGLENFIYLTIGTGIGGGGMLNGNLMHGLLHPEMGHIPLPKDDDAISVCPFHDDCFEGLASGPAIEMRWGVKAEELPVGHPAWEVEASYIAQALRSFICTLSPQRIILGGGVMAQAHLFPLIREKTLVELNGYIQSPEILKRIDEYIVPVALDGKAGILGAFALAEQALKK
ncbi:MAG: ROK family protein [Anaerolineae bacterium]|jgi:fructokinase|nr:ROK family protein [Anaerolineae bacterium]MBT7071998.1 ROK family protein [Anaerolineae bacterium]MBT7323994.1 ROK family protein [Anaerolineae bacterium]